MDRSGVSDFLFVIVNTSRLLHRRRGHRQSDSVAVSDFRMRFIENIFMKKTVNISNLKGWKATGHMGWKLDGRKAPAAGPELACSPEHTTMVLRRPSYDTRMYYNEQSVTTSVNNEQQNTLQTSSDVSLCLANEHIKPANLWKTVDT